MNTWLVTLKVGYQVQTKTVHAENYLPKINPNSTMSVDFFIKGGSYGNERIASFSDVIAVERQ